MALLDMYDLKGLKEVENKKECEKNVLERWLKGRLISAIGKFWCDFHGGLALDILKTAHLALCFQHHAKKKKKNFRASC